MITATDYNYILQDLRDKFNAPYSNKPAQQKTQQKKQFEYKDLVKKYSAMPRENAPLAPKHPVAQQEVDAERYTEVTIDFGKKSRRVRRLDNGYVGPVRTYSTDKEFASGIWYALHSVHTCSVNIWSRYYRTDIATYVWFCKNRNIDVKIIVPGRKPQVFTSIDQFSNYFRESAIEEDEHNIGAENLKLINTYARELLPYLKKSSETLKDILRSQLRLSGYDLVGYDAELKSAYAHHTLNSGKIDDSKGVREWSRDYTKSKDRYVTQLNDLLLMYISAKYYKSQGFEEMNRYGISESDIDSYTGEVITDPIQINLHEDEVVVPRSACGLGLQEYMN